MLFMPLFNPAPNFSPAHRRPYAPQLSIQGA